MKNFTRIIIFSCFIASVLNATAQDAATPVANMLEKPNIIKFNISGVGFGYYTLAYERVINPKQTATLAFGFAPELDLPFKNALLNLYGDNEQAKTAIESTTLTSVSITPGYRFYTGIKGAPFGFYFESFLRYTHMSHQGTYQFTLKSGEVHNPDITTSFNGFGAGEMIGMQWALGNSLSLDLWILGPFVGVLNGSAHGVDDKVISDDDKPDLESDIESVNIPGWNIDATVTDDPNTGLGIIDADLSGLFFGARIFGVCLGYRF